jgi:hypothetical protein
MPQFQLLIDVEMEIEIMSICQCLSSNYLRVLQMWYIPFHFLSYEHVYVSSAVIYIVLTSLEKVFLNFFERNVFSEKATKMNKK